MSGGRGEWFAVQELGDGITVLREPRIHRLLRANIWRFAGERPLWVDAGSGVRSPLAEFPLDAEAAPTLVLTHAHIDHAGGACWFPDARVHAADAAASRGAPLALAAKDVTTRLGIGDAPLGRPLPEVLVAGWPSEAAAPLAGTGPGEGARELHGGEHFEAGSRRFEVIELPGHTPGSIGLWDERAGVLVSGDALYRGALIDELPESNRAHYRETMRRILELSPTLVLPGHGPPLGREETLALARGYLAR